MSIHQQAERKERVEGVLGFKISASGGMADAPPFWGPLLLNAALATLLVGSLAWSAVLPVGIGAVVASTSALGLLSSAFARIHLAARRVGSPWLRVLDQARADLADEELAGDR